MIGNTGDSDEDAEEPYELDDDWSKKTSNEERGLLGKDSDNFDRFGRFFMVIITDVLILVACILFLQEASQVCDQTGESDCASTLVAADRFSIGSFLTAGLAQLLALFCALLANFKKKRTFVPFVGSVFTLLGIVAGFAAGILGHDLDRAVPGLVVSTFAFLGFFSLGIVTHGGMSLRKDNTGAAYAK